MSRTPTTIERLGALLKEYFHVQLFSSVRNKPLRLLDCLWAIIYRRNTTDLILIDTYSTQYFWLAYMSGKLARQLNIPYIPILHGGALPQRYSKSPHLVTRFLNDAAAVVSPSDFLKTFFENQGFKVQTIPNFIDLSDYQYSERKKVQPKLLYVRSLHRKYNPMMAVSVLVDLLEDFPEAELCLVGPDKDGSLAELRKFVDDLDLTHKVKFTGLLSLQEWTSLSKDYDIFINTTNVDNTPVSVIEAMALGMPIVSTDVDGIPFLLEDKRTALLVPPMDKLSFVNAIKLLLKKDELSNKLSTNARSKAETFHQTPILVKWVSLINEVTHEP